VRSRPPHPSPFEEPLTRRGFVKRALVTGAGLVTAGRLAESAGAASGLAGSTLSHVSVRNGSKAFVGDRARFATISPRSANNRAKALLQRVKDDEVQLFESGAILIHLGLQDDRLLPTDTASRMRGIAWLIAALNSVEPAIFPLLMINVFNKGEAWTAEAGPKFVERLTGRLQNVSDALGDKDWLEGEFSIGDLMLVTVLRQLRGTGILDRFPNLAALVKRGEDRPAFQRALSDQLAVFREHEPQGEPA